MIRPVLLSPLLLTALWAGPGHAQERTVIQAENVRYAYAQVLRVTPVFQTLTATSLEQRGAASTEDDTDSRLSRVVGAVKDALTREDDPPELEEGCVAVPVQRKFKRPIAYDVDYVYKGAKYRSRLPEDPGNRLRIRIGVTPVVTATRSR